ncbi:MAG: aldehyde dehydrogenase family protein [Oceanospirillaceae bacterium]|jgi:aldehyde dehydrogenase (NAD+)|nr:aldehyde dehydrogenase family protein [Oceanospirillaceae bacterium]MBT4443821.1 aldehyde dehydrogenase family protein [Oceanospirillaceae bacterium]MBT6078132.1 aldehyde dehydrogenase family protein [Oceanospirillaceae bacterium]MBT7329471.1 aldehyde dehydrogenase family protein [Oceanospirillaceae bacterium]
MIDTKKFYINGAWVAPLAATDLDVIDPSTEQVCATISIGGAADTDAAVAAAKAAFESWSQTPKAERLGLLQKFLEIYQARASEMGQAISQEMGAPIDMANASQVGTGIWHTKILLRELDKFEFERPLNDRAPNDKIIYEPIGVCALITPWNWPMNQVTLKAIAAMAAGCTMVLKPSEISPLSGLVFADMIHEAGIPAGVFNLVNGDGVGVGSQLTSHADVDMVSFTGSTRAGALISKNAADSVKRVALELGGKGANIVFADADEKAIVRGVRHCFNNTGQSCNAPTRMLVERSIYDQAVEAAIQVAAKTKVGRAAEAGNHIGPVVSELQYNKIQGLIKVGIDEGARVIAGGLGKPEGLETGYFVKPTIFADVNNDMQIAREEVFGPVLCMIPFDTEEEALAIANDTVYGLTNYVQTQDGNKANRVARRLRSGMVEMNGTSRAAGAPFGGYKQSGNGREGGVWGLEDFLEVKSISGWTND